jgi:hypothetical protein
LTHSPDTKSSGRGGRKDRGGDVEDLLGRFEDGGRLLVEVMLFSTRACMSRARLLLQLGEGVGVWSIVVSTRATLRFKVVSVSLL